MVGIDFLVFLKDNLFGFDGIFERFFVCNCDLIDIVGRVFYFILVFLIFEGLINIIGIILGVVELIVFIDVVIFFMIDFGVILDVIFVVIIDFIFVVFILLVNVDLVLLCNFKVVVFDIIFVDYEDFIVFLGYYFDKKYYKECNCNCDCDDCCCNKGILDNFYMLNINN